jgi:hypothetical protein
VIDQAQTARVAAGLRDAVDAAKRQPCPSSRVVFAQAERGELLDLALEMKAKLFVKLTLDGIAPEDCTQAHSKILQHGAPLSS